MRIECPECRSVCDIDLDAQSDTTCPSCGHVLTTDGRSVRDFRDATVANSSLPSPSEWQSLLEPTAIQASTIPAKIGGFEVRRELGEGGFARVVLAYDTRLDREVAIKVPKPGSASSRRGWLGDEARAAGKLRHPNILRLYEFVDLPDGSPAVVMEYIDGPSLREFMQSANLSGEPLTLDRSVALMIQVAEAVHYAHTKGLVHRDLKPGNILLDSSGRAHVADFGLALHEQDQHQHMGEVAGTMPYMAPEQVRGETHHLDGRCDVWALGAILYELLTGRRPFTGTREQIRDNILQRPLKPPRQIDDSIPAELEQIVVRCLEKDIGRRYPTALDLARDLQNWLAPTASTSSEPGRPVRRRRLVLASLAVVLLGAIGFALSGDLLPTRGSSGYDPVLPQYDLFRDTTSFAQQKWTSLLDRSPLRFLWFDSPEWMWDYDPSRELLLTSSHSVGLLGVGRAEFTTFRLQMTFLKPTPNGNAGIFLGATPYQASDGRHWRAQLVFVQCGHQGDTSVRRQTADFKEYPDGLRMATSHEFAQVEVPPFGTDEHLLQVEVWGNTVRNIKWDGRDLEGLADQNLTPLLPTYQPANCQGVLGVVNYLGSTTFRDYRLMWEAP